MSITELEYLRDRIANLEQRLIQSDPHVDREMLLAVLETSVAAVCVLDTGGQIIYANRQAEGILGLQRSEIVTRTYDDPGWKATDLHGGPWPDEKQPFTIVSRTSKPVHDIRHAIEWPDGRRKLLSINGAPIVDQRGNIRRLVFSVTDITDRYKVHERLRRSEERYRALFEALPGYVVSVGRDHRIQFVNRALPDLRVEDVIGAPVEQFLAPEYREAYGRALNTVFETGEIQELEARTDPAAGESSWFLIRMGPVNGEDGVDSVTVVGIDITEHKTVSAQLRHSQRIESIGRLAGGVAHDFNNLLTAVLGYADMLHHELAGQPELVQAVDQIQMAADRGAQLTRQLLTFAGRQVTQPSVVAPNDLIAEASGMLCRLIGEDIAFETDLAPTAPPVRIDPGQLEQVLVNLAVNARDAMPGGGRLSVVCRAVSDPDALPFEDPDHRQWAEIAVSDTGFGMTDDTRQHLFEPFFTTKPPGKGTGLGLATSFGIVEQCGGHIAVTSDPGEGSAFRVFLPACAERTGTSRPERAHSLPRGGHERILLVEDDPAVRRTLRRSLEQSGYRVTEAADGRSGLRLCLDPDFEVDLLITDVVMPVMSGTDLAARLLASRPQAKILFISGYATNDEALVMLRRGGVNFVQKPFDTSQLGAKVREILDGA